MVQAIAGCDNQASGDFGMCGPNIVRDSIGGLADQPQVAQAGIEDQIVRDKVVLIDAFRLRENLLGETDHILQI